MFRRALFLVAAGVGTATAVTYLAFRPLWKRWGVDPAETARALPGDDIVPQAMAADTRGIRIAAPPREVWPWLVQMGYGRAGWYSYDAIDMAHPSAREILPEFQALAVGDMMPTTPGFGFAVRIVEPEHALVLYLDSDLVREQAALAGKGEAGGETPTNLRLTGATLGTMTPGEFKASWAFVLEPTEDGGTRLIERSRFASAMEGRLGNVMGGMLGLGVFVMTRRQLLGVKERAEAAARQRTPTEAAASPSLPMADPVPA